MPTVDYVFVDPSAITHEICVISDAEWNRRIEQEHRWESDGRIARREINAYDAEFSAMLTDRNAEKAKVRNRRKADRKHKMTPKMRKEQEFDRSWKIADKLVNWNSWDDMPVAEFRTREAEKHDRSDWEIEKENHADQMRKIGRLESILDSLMEWSEEVDSWFMDSDIRKWMRSDGILSYGAENRIDENRQYKEEIKGYMAESDMLYADEEYYRKQKSVGVRADLYLKKGEC